MTHRVVTGISPSRLAFHWEAHDRHLTVTVDNEDTYGPYPVGRSEVTFTGRILRFDVEESTGGNTGATEIEVFAAQ